jgi:predicted ATPase
VIVSDATWRLAQGYFTGQPLEGRGLKEMATPVQAYRILGASGAQSRLDAAPPWQLTPLVGREAELALLRDRWIQAQSGLGQVVALSGEPGIGKSRLAQAFHQDRADEPHLRLEWRCSPDAQQNPLQPVIDYWRQRLSQASEDALADRLHALEAALATYELAQPEVTPLFAALLSLPHPAPYPPLALSPQQQRRKTLEALRTWLLAEAARQPVLFIVEDLHWSDPSTLEFLTLLLDQGPIARLFMLLTCRPEFKAPWSFHAHCTPLTLARLPNDLATEMIGRLAGHQVLPPHIIAQIAAKTDGVPLFIEELTKMVLESERLQPWAPRDALHGALPRLDIPATLHDSLMARLDRLGPVKALAQLGAVIGRTFDYDVLQAVADMDGVALRQGLRQLVEAELVYQQGIPPRATYMFKHALIQDAAAQSLLRRVRQQYHQRIAQAMEAQFAELAALQPELLAHHYTEAGLPALALPYYRRAGENAVARSAFREAAALFEQALESMQHPPDSRDAMTQAIDLRLALRSALRPLGEFRRSLAALREAETLAARLNDTRRLGQVAVFLNVQFRMMGAYEQGKAAAQRALAAASADGDALLRALAHQFLGIIHHDQGDYDQAIHCLEQAITALATTHQHEFDGVDLLPDMLSRATLASCHAERGSFAAGFDLAEEALRVAEAASHSSSLIYGYWAIGRLALRQGDAPRALSLLEQAVDRCQQIGIPGYFARVAADLGAAYVLAGQVDAAVALLIQAREQTAAPEMQGLHALCGIALGEAQMRAGRWGQAHAIAEQTLALTLAHRERSHQAYTLRLLGDLAARRDAPEIEQAEAFYQQALALAKTLGMRPLQAHCHRSLGDLYAMSSQRKQAHTELSVAIDFYRDMEMTFWLPQLEAELEQLSNSSR